MHHPAKKKKFWFFPPESFQHFLFVAWPAVSALWDTAERLLEPISVMFKLIIKHMQCFLFSTTVFDLPINVYLYEFKTNMSHWP